MRPCFLKHKYCYIAPFYESKNIKNIQTFKKYFFFMINTVVYSPFLFVSFRTFRPPTSSICLRFVFRFFFSFPKMLFSLLLGTIDRSLEMYDLFLWNYVSFLDLGTSFAITIRHSYIHLCPRCWTVGYPKNKGWAKP